MLSTKEELSRALRELDSVKAEYQKFAHAVSHDLSASFRHIEAFSTLILEDNRGKFEGKTKRYFDFVINSASAGTRILGALLEFSRIDTREQPFVDVDCNEIVEDALVSLSDMIDARKACIDVASLPVISADRDQVAKVFFHLLKNALTFCDESSRPQVSLKSKNIESGVEFAVSDNGIGIRTNQVARIFDVLGRAVGDEFPGEGMGLAVSKKVVQRHGGEIRVESQEGGGSTFFFSIKTAE